MRTIISTPPLRCWARFEPGTPAPNPESRFRVEIQFQGLELETFDLLQRLAGDSLEVAVHSNRTAHAAFNLLFASRRLFRDRLAFPVEVLLHRGESLDDRFDPLAESRTGQILIDHFGFRLLPLGGLPRQGDF